MNNTKEKYDNTNTALTGEQKYPYQGAKIYETPYGYSVHMVKEIDKGTGKESGSLFIVSPENEMSEVIRLSRHKAYKANFLDELANFAGDFDRNTIAAIRNRVLDKIKEEASARVDSKIPIKEVHKLLTLAAILEDKTELFDGIEYCVFTTDDFKKKIKEENYGYKNHLEVINKFRLMGILKSNSGRSDYRGTDHVPKYCFLPAQGVTAENDQADFLEVVV